MELSVRELTVADIDHLIAYWTNSDEAYMRGMGVDTTKLPGETEWRQMLSKQLSEDYPQKQSYCTIWTLNGKPIGHSNANKIIFGEEAYMHLHIWHAEYRSKGIGQRLLPHSINLFFNRLQLQRLYCEPAAFNESPNRTLKILGFELEKTYTTIPGYICFEQEVNKWVLTKDRFLSKINRQ